MIQIIQLKGKDKRLYRLLAPLVMDPDVIRANNNYPFKTSEDYVWYIAVDGKEVKMNVTVGQQVIYSKYAGTSVEIEDEEYIVVKQDDILAIIE